MLTRTVRQEGAWHSKGSSPCVIKLPTSDIAQLVKHSLYKLPIFSSKVQAGFPSPAEDYVERHLDLNSEYIKHPAATFLVTAAGESMVDVGIFDGDVLVVDRSLEPTDGSIVIAALNGELTVKRLSRKQGQVQLLPANSQFKAITITEEIELVIWGVVTLVLHRPI